MGKKGKGSSGGGAATGGAGGVGEDAALFRQRAKALRATGDTLFGQGKMRDALASYDSALTLTPDKCTERAHIHANRAACYMRERRWQEALRECSAALEAEPGYTTALLRRAQAYVALGASEPAAADLEAALKSGGAETTRAALKLKALMAASDAGRASKGGAKGAKGGPSGLGGSGLMSGGRGASSLGASSGAAYASSSVGAVRPRAQAPPNLLSVKVTLEGADGAPATTKTIFTPLQGGYPELLAAVSASFPDAGALALRYLDAEGDTVTMNSRADVKMALHTAVQRHVRELEDATKAAGPAAPKLSPPPGTLPPLVLLAARCEASPLAPRDELPDAGTPEPADDIVEIDEWMLELSAMFRERLGLPEGATVDMREIGVDKCCEVLEEVVALPEAGPLLDGAAAKFQEAAAAALYNWGNVHTCAARKRNDAAAQHAARLANDAVASAGPEAEVSAQAAMEAAYERATADSLPIFDEGYTAASERFAASLAVKADFADAALAWGQQAFERAKLLSLRAKEAPPRATAAEVDAAFTAAADKFRETLVMLPPEPEAADGADKASSEAQQPAAEAGQKANVQILHGNVLFEWSQVAHARGDPEASWRKLVDDAVGCFKAAGCQQADITHALEGHPSGAWKPAPQAAGGDAASA